MFNIFTWKKRENNECSKSKLGLNPNCDVFTAHALFPLTFFLIFICAVIFLFIAGQ